MSSEHGSPERVPETGITDSLMDRLQQVYNQYQQQHVYDRLNQIAVEMEDTLLQVTMADILFEETIDLDDSAQQTVAEVRTALNQEGGTIEDHSITIDEADIDELERVVTTEAERVETRIHELRTQHASAVKAMQQLNEELNVAESDQLAVLSNLLSDWNWRDHVPEADRFEERRSEAVEFAEEMDTVLEESRQNIGAGFEGEEIETLAETLLNGDRLSLTELEPAQRDALAESELGEYLTVSLG